MNKHRTLHDDPYEPLPVNFAAPNLVRLEKVQSNVCTKSTDLGDRMSYLPRPPQSAFRLFFEDEKKRLIKQVRLTKTKRYHKICSREMARIIAKRWDNIDAISYKHYIEMASLDRIRYQREKGKCLQEAVVSPPPPPAAPRSVVQHSKSSIVPIEGPVLPVLEDKPDDSVIRALAQRLDSTSINMIVNAFK